MKRALIITYYWPPSGGAGVQRPLKFVKYLSRHGVRPTVLTVDPEHAAYPVLDPSLSADVPGDIEVVRTRSFEPLRLLARVFGGGVVPRAGFAGEPPPGPFKRGLRWLRGNLFIPDARRGWVRHAVRAATDLLRHGHFDAIVISSPPHSAQLIGLALKKRFPQLRWIADLRDPWTDMWYTRELMQGARAARRNAAWEERVVRTADVLLTTGPSLKRTLTGRYGADAGERIHVLPNGYDTADLPTAAPGPPEGEFRITYVGSMAASYDPAVFFKALGRVTGDNPQARISFHGVGAIDPHIQAMARAAGVDCTWSPPVDHAAALSAMHAAHMLLLVLPDAPGVEQVLPGKLFEYLASRRPIVAIGPLGSDVDAVIRECDAGSMFDRTMEDDLHAHLAGMLQRHLAGEDLRVQKDAHRRYTREALTARLAALIANRASHT